MAGIIEEASSLGMKAEAEVEIAFPLPRMGQIIAEAIHPELENSPAERSEVRLIVEENGKITLYISATDTSALRAALNSYLRWISAITKTLKIFEESAREPVKRN
jgi:tRNA threonylcarbamoyladenosine modification (KEOPS) complex  Pcc1 subunit